MIIIFIAFIAGILTVLAPCILPLLPIIIGRASHGQNKRSPLIITTSLAVSVVLFTLILKVSTALVNVPPVVWSALSGGIIIAFGLISLFPAAWDKLNVLLGLSSRSENMLSASGQQQNHWGDVLIGLSLGPVFSSCSPTYFLILATVLPASFAKGFVALIAYAFGLSLTLMLISILGQRFVQKVGWAANPTGWFKRGLGILFIIVGLFILTGLDTRVQVYLTEHNVYPSLGLEQKLLEQTKDTPDEEASETKEVLSEQSFPRYHELVNPSGFVNSDPFKLSDLVGKKVILVDFMTYSCINCIRTFPYLNAWYSKYKDKGLEIVGIHTPEFAFEHKIENVRKALKQYGIEFPVVLDNDYGTWSAYQNNYWPRKYLIDLNGRIVYDHIGEGGYNETEEKIQELLTQKQDMITPSVTAETVESASPETYFGSERNEYFANGTQNKIGVQNLTLPDTTKLNELNLGGTWNFVKEYATNKTKNALILYQYGAHNVFFVASAAAPIKVEILRDGKPLDQKTAGTDVIFENGRSYAIIQDERLYSLIKDPLPVAQHELKLIIETPGLNAYTFTFG